ncbi:MAG: MBL fold metallo-hydrolase [Fervidicoccaceae archaeon]
MLAGLALGYVGGAIGTGLIRPVYEALYPKVPRGKYQFGAVDKLRITCISETSWFQNDVFMGDIRRAGGLLTNQYMIPWSVANVVGGWSKENPDVGSNEGGFSALVETWGPGDAYHRWLLDWGWNQEWMEYIYSQIPAPTKGVPDDRKIRGSVLDLIKAGPKGIEFVISSHEHIDHYWGMDTVLKYYPDVPVYLCGTMYPESKRMLDGVPKGFFPAPYAWNEHPHKGPRIWVTEPLKPYDIYPGLTVVLYDVPIILRTRGELIPYVWVKDHGIVTVTGCTHPGIIYELEYAIRNFKDVDYGKNMAGVYGGLHISPFEEWDPDKDDLVLALPKYGLEWIGANHCTGYITVGKMIEAGLPVIGGRARFKTRKTWYLGNGDQLGLPMDVIEEPLNLEYYKTRKRVLSAVERAVERLRTHPDDKKAFMEWYRGENPLKVETEFNVVEYEVGYL